MSDYKKAMKALRRMIKDAESKSEKAMLSSIRWQLWNRYQKD